MPKFQGSGLVTGTDPPVEVLATGVPTGDKGRIQQDPRARHLHRDARMTNLPDYDISLTRSEEEARALYGEQ